MLPTTNDLINTSYMEYFESAQADASYEEYLDTEEARKRVLDEELDRIYQWYAEAQSYDDDF